MVFADPPYFLSNDGLTFKNGKIASVNKGEWDKVCDKENSLDFINNFNRKWLALTREKTCGKHPTQKPLALLARIILAASKENAWVLDPFTGSSTTGIAANLFNRKFVGIDKEIEFLEISKRRKIEIENPQNFKKFKEKLI